MSCDSPKLSAPNNKPLIVHIVLNVENWQIEKNMPRKIITPPHGIEHIPDIPNYSWAEYGMRCGFPRILNLLQNRNLPASTNINAGVIDAYPQCAEAMLKAGWEFIGHGYQQHAVDSADDEDDIIRRTTEKLTSFTGVQPRGWLGPGLCETFKTPDLLKKNGYDYVCDWVIDDLPCWMSTKYGPLIAMPYNLEINDSVIYAVEKHSSDEMYLRIINTLSTFEEELKTNSRILTIALHPHLIGVPHRFNFFVRMIDLLMARNDVEFMNGSQIADWFVSLVKPEDVEF